MYARCLKNWNEIWSPWGKNEKARESQSHPTRRLTHQCHSMMFIFTNGMEDAKAIQINAVDQSNLEDGDYIGSFDLTRWTNEIKLTVKDHKIIALDVVEDVMFKMDEVTKALFDRVIHWMWILRLAQP